jgi:uncharacterized protein (TIGR02421 family)
MGTVLSAHGANGAPRFNSLSAYAARVRTLSERLVEILRPIRILEAVHWGPEIERAFFARGGRELPPVTSDYYARRPLPFDPDRKQQELQALKRDVARGLGSQPAGRILARMCREYGDVVRLLAGRGTRAFAEMSGRLYGRSTDRCRRNGPSLACLGKKLARSGRGDGDEPKLNARQAVTALATRLGPFFGDGSVHVRLCDGLMADAVACGDSLRVRGGARFTERDVRLLEVHEGWVHLGTTLNGWSQAVCTFLTKGPPSSTVTQEGLAVLTEVLSEASHSARMRRLGQRVEAVARAEAGADFLDVYRYLLGEGYEPSAAYRQATRIFRGSLPAGIGPFTKDLSYCKGMVAVWDFVRQAVDDGTERRLALLFCGKTALGDVEALAQLEEEGLLLPPRHVPPPFVKRRGFAVRGVKGRGTLDLGLLSRNPVLGGTP